MIGRSFGGWAHNNALPLALSSLPTNQLYQRDIGATTAAVPFAGVRPNTNTTEGRVRLVSDNSVIVDWTTISSSLPFEFSGTLTVPQGGPYYRDVRDSITAATVTDTAPFSVGVVVGVYGQSNALYFVGQQTAPVPTPNANTWVYAPGVGWVLSGSTAAATAFVNGNGARQILNNIQSYLSGIPVGLVFWGLSGTSLSGLMQGTAPYITFTSNITGSGGKLEDMFWIQAENDAASLEPEVNYLSNLDVNLHAPLAALVGRSKSEFLLFTPSLASYGGTGNSTEAGWAGMQTTLKHAGDGGLAGVVYSHTDIDAPRLAGDNFHVDGVGQQARANRFALTWAAAKGIVAHKAAWFPTAAVRVDNTHTDITVVHSAGTDFTPTNGITGFALSLDGWGTTITPSAAVRQNATTIRLTHPDMGTFTKRVRYQVGAHPDMSAGVFDNSSVVVPLNYTADDLVCTGSVSTPSPVFVLMSGTATFPTGSTEKFTGIGYGTPGATVPSGQRYLMAVLTRSTGGATINSVTIQKSGQSDIVLTSGSGLTALGNVAGGQAYFAQCALPDAYGSSGDIVIQFSASVFSTATIRIYVVDQSTLSSTTVVSTAFNTASSATSVSSGNFATSSGGFTLVGGTNDATSGSTPAVTDNATVVTYSSHTIGAAAGVVPVGAEVLNVASGATNACTATWTASANLVIGLVHMR